MMFELFLQMEQYGWKIFQNWHLTTTFNKVQFISNIIFACQVFYDNKKRIFHFEDLVSRWHLLTQLFYCLASIYQPKTSEIRFRSTDSFYFNAWKMTQTQHNSNSCLNGLVVVMVNSQLSTHREKSASVISIKFNHKV